jgi:hypothetical protein
MVVEVTHVAYSDETHHNVGRFKGIGVVTATIDHAAQASEEVKVILATANVRELKWEKLRTARDRLAAIRVTDWLFSRINVLRVDVLTWDIEDPRHKLRGRDDVANLHRMYYHLMNKFCGGFQLVVLGNSIPTNKIRLTGSGFMTSSMARARGVTFKRLSLH